MSDVDAHMEGLSAESAATMRKLRGMILSAAPDVGEHIKWNAPSFTVEGDDRITLGLDRKGGVRLVLHRGAQAAPSNGFTFDDPHQLAAWPASDRGVMHFPTTLDLTEKQVEVTELVTRWLRETR